MELPSAQEKIHAVYKDDVIVVAFTPSGGTYLIQSLREEYNLQFRLCAQASQIFKKFKVIGSPYIIIIDKQGIVRYRKNAYLDDERISFLKNLLLPPKRNNED